MFETQTVTWQTHASCRRLVWKKKTNENQTKGFISETNSHVGISEGLHQKKGNVRSLYIEI